MISAVRPTLEDSIDGRLGHRVFAGKTTLRDPASGILSPDLLGLFLGKLSPYIQEPSVLLSVQQEHLQSGIMHPNEPTVKEG